VRGAGGGGAAALEAGFPRIVACVWRRLERASGPAPLNLVRLKGSHLPPPPQHPAPTRTPSATFLARRYDTFTTTILSDVTFLNYKYITYPGSPTDWCGPASVQSRSVSRLLSPRLSARRIGGEEAQQTALAASGQQTTPLSRCALFPAGRRPASQPCPPSSPARWPNNAPAAFRMLSHSDLFKPGKNIANLSKGLPVASVPFQLMDARQAACRGTLAGYSAAGAAAGPPRTPWQAQGRLCLDLPGGNPATSSCPPPGAPASL
jgi:hypothetical protein